MKSIKEQGFFGKNCGWITSCFLAGLCMGTGAFIYASNYAKYGIFGTGLTGPINVVFYTLFKAIRESKYRC